ncbi:MAG: hypothetical protein EOO18_09120 [Chryseobacterium sp.]|nr:MAG: hypothetical protein EOO18_09120 [Chryseobacterium sp.]
MEGMIRNSATIAAETTSTEKKRAAEKVEKHENTPEIFRIIKKNYELLKRGRIRHMDDNEYIMMKTNDFLADGVNPKFITSTFTSENGSVWKCFFEMCFSMGKEHTIIKDFPDQAKPDAS